MLDVPPVGVKVIFTFTVALPELFSFWAVLPFGLTRSFTVPGPETAFDSEAEADLTPLPLSVRLPESATVTGSCAVPLCLLSFGLPALTVLTGAVRLSDQPPVTDPWSAAQQSTMKRLQVPLAALPLRASRFTGYGPGGAGGEGSGFESVDSLGL